MGFCLLDHIAVAARYAQREHGLQRVMIVDVDVHHGNGTHDCFYHDPEVFFLSTHQVTGGKGEGSGLCRICVRTQSAKHRQSNPLSLDR